MVFLMLLAALANEPRGTIEAVVRGSDQPLAVELLRRNEAEEWDELEHRNLAKNVRRVRFEGLEPGVYQVRLRGPQATEQLGTKVVVGRGDTRRIAIAIEPFVLQGRVTMGGMEAGGTIALQHREFQWRAGVAVAPDGTFRVPMWQRGELVCKVRTPALPAAFTQIATLEGASPRLDIDIPDGRVRGVVRDAKSGAGVAGALVVLQTNTADSEELARLTTNAEGAFDFTGVRHGRQKLRVLPARHLEPEAVSFALDDAAPLRELDLHVDGGREVAVLVIDKANDPIAGAKVICVSDSRICARTTTDEDGRAEIAVPQDGQATLFAISREGPFAMVRAGRDGGRLRIYLPSTASSLQLRALTTDGRTMPPFSLLMRFNGELVPAEVAEELAVVQGLRLATGTDSEARLQNIPSGSYEFWPYRTDEEVDAIVAAGAMFPPIQVDVRAGENEFVVRFAAR